MVDDSSITEEEGVVHGVGITRYRGVSAQRGVMESPLFPVIPPPTPGGAFSNGFSNGFEIS